MQMTPTLSRFIWSKAIAWALSLVIAFWVFYKPPGNPISWDVFGYYYYLPATVIHKGPVTDNIDWVNEINAKYQNTATLYQFFKHENGNWIDKYSMGMSALYAPFFLGGHVAAKMGAGIPDGYSKPYQWAIILGALFYTLLGIALLRKILIKFFDEITAAIVLLLIVLGTNYFHNAAFSSAMPHNVLFTLYTLILWSTIRWHEDHQWKHIVLLASACGFAILARPTEILCLLIPLFWGVLNFSTLKEKLFILWKYKWMIALFALVILGIGIPQLIYWKQSTGEWLYFSYNNNPGEGFEFRHPHLLQVLFSFRKGWFIYTPLMLFAVMGFINLWKRQKTIFYPLLIFFLLNVYLVSSWSCWWYADSFGQRALVQSYPLMALPLGFFIKGLWNLRPVFYKPILCLFFILGSLNLFQTWQLENGILATSRMTSAYYFRIFGKTAIHPEDEKLLLVNRSYGGPEIFSDPDHKYAEIILEKWDFESPIEGLENKNFSDSIHYSGGHSYRLNKEYPFTPAITRKYKDLTKKDHAWIRFSYRVFPYSPLDENPLSVVFAFNHEGKLYKYNAILPLAGSWKINQWNNLFFDYLTPEVRSADDKLETYLWLRGDQPVFIDDIEVKMFQEK